MIRIRGPVGTLRVLMLPGEGRPTWDEAEGGLPSGTPSSLELDVEATRPESTRGAS